MASGGTVEISRADGTPTLVENAAANWAAHLLIVFMCVLVGTSIRTRRELLASLEDRALRAESERASRAREAVLLERARIAREMHDVLGHKISLLTMQAGALEVNPAAGADVIEREAGRIRLTAREALEDLRSVIGALEEDAAPREPGPGLAEVPGLVARYLDAGARIDLEDAVTTRLDVADVDASAGRAIHRVLTESLTNAHRHAPRSPVQVRLSGEPGRGVDLLIENPAESPAVESSTVASTAVESSGGTGLTGLAERVRLAGGVFGAGMRDGVFRVEAWFPWSVRDDDSPTSREEPIR
ncbi:sensor histidine kinase [Mobilicoccus massiliensis]|uniref:sensor histidine kinase n=1 Tax=Mobilicoccus massiliensis TaxID=1522310 RepID=UPI0006938F76|nr:histidine kinase [Mobilicoccus massiliensis]